MDAINNSGEDRLCTLNNEPEDIVVGLNIGKMHLELLLELRKSSIVFKIGDAGVSHEFEQGENEVRGCGAPQDGEGHAAVPRKVAEGWA